MSKFVCFLAVQCADSGRAVQGLLSRQACKTEESVQCESDGKDLR